MAMTSRAVGAVSRAVASNRFPSAGCAAMRHAPSSYRSPESKLLWLIAVGQPSGLRHGSRPRRGRIADAGARAIRLHDQVWAREIERQHAMLDDLERPVGFERQQDLGSEPPVGRHQT